MKKKFAVISQWPEGINSEKEVVEKMKICATELGLTCLVLDKNGFSLDGKKEIEPLDVDFVIHLHFETPKCFDAFSYIALWNPLQFYFDWGYRKHSDNLLTHNDFISCSSQWADDHIKRLIYGDNTRLPPLFTVFHSVASPIIPPKLLDKRFIFYCGINWEKLGRGKGRFEDVLKALDNKSLIKIYGPKKLDGVNVWKGFSSYEGELPFNGTSVVKALADCGIGLAFSSDAHKQSELMSTRIFESAAAGAVIISDEHSFARENFGDSILYIDGTLSAPEIAADLMKHIKWINNNKSEALLLAKRSQAIFLEKFHLTLSIQNIYANHLARKHHLDSLYKAQSDRYKVNIIYYMLIYTKSNLELFVQSINAQEYRNIVPYLLIDKRIFALNKVDIKKIISKSSHKIIILDNDIYTIIKKKSFIKKPVGLLLIDVLKFFGEDDLLCISCDGERMFSDHVSSLVRKFEDNPSALLVSSDILVKTRGHNKAYRTLQRFNAVINKVEVSEVDFCFSNIIFKRSIILEGIYPMIRYLSTYLLFYLRLNSKGSILGSGRATVLKTFLGNVAGSSLGEGNELEVIIDHHRDIDLNGFSNFLHNCSLKQRRRLLIDLIKAFPGPPVLIKILKFIYRNFIVKYIKD